MRYESYDDSDWTPEERARFDALLAERIPPAALKERTMRALRGRGQLAAKPRIRVRSSLLIAIAATVVFVAGAAAGYALAMQRLGVPATRESIASRQSLVRAESVGTAPRQSRQVVWF